MSTAPTMCVSFGCQSLAEFIVEGESPGASHRAKLFLCNRHTRERLEAFPAATVTPVGPRRLQSESMHPGAVDLKLMSLVEDFAAMRYSMNTLRGLVTDTQARVIRCERRIAEIEPTDDLGSIDQMFKILAGMGVEVDDDMRRKAYNLFLGNEPEAEPEAKRHPPNACELCRGVGVIERGGITQPCDCVDR